MDIEAAKTNPAAAFDDPKDVLSAELSRKQKIEILRRWEYDAREIEVASEEAMTGGAPSRLDEVLQALNTLDADDEAAPSPTKQGGV